MCQIELNAFLKVSKAGKHLSPTGVFFTYLLMSVCTIKIWSVACFAKEKSNLALVDVAASQIQFNSLIEAASK